MGYCFTIQDVITRAILGGLLIIRISQVYETIRVQIFETQVMVICFNRASNLKIDFPASFSLMFILTLVYFLPLSELRTGVQENFLKMEQSGAHVFLTILPDFYAG